MRFAVLINAGPRSSNAREAARHARAARDAFAEAGVHAEVRTVPAEELEAQARRVASVAEVVVVGGGDGTASSGARALAGSPAALAVLPLGTFNHFAKDLGMPLELREAALAVAAGEERTIDLGEVNGRPFLNNVSIGFYPRAVQEREEKRRGVGWAKWRALAHGFLWGLLRVRLLRVQVRAEGRRLRVRTPFVFVGNNRYDLRLPAPARRQRLDAGELCLVVARTKSRLGLLRLVVLTLAGRLDQAEEADVLHPRELRIESGRRPLRVGLDGEIERLAPPLSFRTLPGALRVIGPRR